MAPGNGVLEITLLNINSSTPPTSPQVLSSLQDTRSLLAEKVLPTYSRFYQNIDRPQVIFILGIWPSLESHHEFLSSDLREEVLGGQEGLFDFNWSIHVELGSSGGSKPQDVVEDVKRQLKEAKGLEVGRWMVKTGKESEFFENLTKQETEGEEGLKGFQIAVGWRCDAPHGDREYVRIKGWSKREDAGNDLHVHEGWRKGGFLSEEETDVCEKVEVKTAWNMEH